MKAARNFCSERLYKFIDDIWLPLVKRSIQKRYETVAVFVGILLISFSLLAGGWVKWQFFPALEAEEVAIVVDLPEGTPINKTAEVTKIIEREALKLKNELNADSGKQIIAHVLTTVGAQYFSSQEAESSPTGPVVQSSTTPHLMN